MPATGHIPQVEDPAAFAAILGKVLQEMSR